MTTLPMHPDGKGIDWIRLCIKDNCLMRDNLFWSLEGFAAAVAAHERERCVKWHDEQRTALLRRKIPNGTQLEIHAREMEIQFHSESAAAFREMEP